MNIYYEYNMNLVLNITLGTKTTPIFQLKN